MREIGVFDSACLIGLGRIKRWDLLSGHFREAYVPPAVQNEIGSLPDDFVVRVVQNQSVVSVLKTQLGDGEAEAIALAMELSDVLIVLDDKKARRIAHEIRLKVVGTVGILLNAKERGLITEIKPVMNALLEVGFRISVGLYREALRLADEKK